MADELQKTGSDGRSIAEAPQPRFIVLPAIGTLVFEPGLALLALGAIDTWL
jgi:hypothetical protein